MLRVYGSLVLVLSLLFFVACSDDDDSGNPSTPSTDPSEITLTVGDGNGNNIDLNDYPSISYEGSSVVLLGDLIQAETVSSLFEGTTDDCRENCVYRFYASDGFTPIARGRADLTWDIFQQGVVAIESHNTYYPAELELPGAYNVGDMESILVLPKISIAALDTVYWYNLADFTVETIEEIDVIHLGDFFPDSLITPLFPNWSNDNLQELFTFRFKALDGFTPFDVGREDLTWETIQQGHMEVVTRNLSFPSELGLPGAYNTTNLASMSLHRKLDVIDPGASVFHRIEDLETEIVTTQDGDNIAIPLANLIPEEFKNDSYTFSCFGVSTDISSTPEMDWGTFQNGYYLVEKDKTWFGGGQYADDDYRIRFVQGIRISQQ